LGPIATREVGRFVFGIARELENVPLRDTEMFKRFPWRVSGILRALALQVGHGDVLLVVAVVAKQVLGECVCHHLIHIDTDTLHNDALTMDAAMLSSFCACFFCGASRAGSQ